MYPALYFIRMGADRRRTVSRISARGQGSFGGLRDPASYAGIRVARDPGDRRDSGGFFLCNSGHANGWKPGVLHHGLRRLATPVVLPDSSAVSHALQIE